MEKKYFFDAHCHLMNLSHPNLLAFINRALSEITRRKKGRGFSITHLLKTVFLYLVVSAVLIVSIVCIPVVSLIGKIPLIGGYINDAVRYLIRWVMSIQFVKRVFNLVTIMQNDLGDMLLAMEKDALQLKPVVKDLSEKETPVTTVPGGDLEFDHIILTPLLMDFGYKGFKKLAGTYYRIQSKPIVEQVADVFSGIKKYIQNAHNSHNPLFEIYPFLGMNTQNYYLADETYEKVNQIPDLSRLSDGIRNKSRFYKETMQFVFSGEMTDEEKVEIRKIFNSKKDRDAIDKIYSDSQNMEKRNSIKKMFEKYFGEYTDVSPEEKHESFKKNLGNFNGDVEKISSHYFIGVKVYPPLGFDPWPDNDPLELEKVKYLYAFCEKKRIPIVTHCSHGGFCVLKDSKRRLFTDPTRWGNVLEKYKDLILDFAHFGGDADKDQTDGWMDKIIDLILKYENVYADISCICFKDEHYGRLNASFEKMRFKNEEQKNKLMQRIMFGTDFMINLLWAESYKSYLENFFATPFFTGEKEAFCSVNPSRFLFGDAAAAQVKILHLVTGKKKPSPV